MSSKRSIHLFNTFCEEENTRSQTRQYWQWTDLETLQGLDALKTLTRETVSKTANTVGTAVTLMFDAGSLR